jgi:hypothetical protein
MAKLKISCPGCRRTLLCDEKYRDRDVRCPHCKLLFPVPNTPLPRVAHHRRHRHRHRGRKKIIIAAALGIILLLLAAIGLLFTRPTDFRWTDHRPIGVLFLASNGHISATNPRGWFNDDHLDVTGTNGPERFHQALTDFTTRSIDILKRAGAQGVIVWDLEGQEYPHKTSYIGDPRLLGQLAPEMAPVADEFFSRLRGAGFKVGLTIRPQQLVFADNGIPRQIQVTDIKQTLLDKIDYARAHWGATMFYVDSNGGIRRPDEVWQLRSLMQDRPDILLIPEHSYLPYQAFSAPYVDLKKQPDATAGWARKLFPGSFQAVDISDASPASITSAWLRGDVLLFRAWYWTSECQLLENLAQQRK